MTARGLAVPPSLAIILFPFKYNIHYVKLTIQSMFGYHLLEITHTLLPGLLGGAVTLHWAKIQKKFSGFKENWVGARAQECQRQLGHYHTQTQRVHSWPNKPFGSMSISSSCITSRKLWLVCLAGISLEDPAPETLTDYSYMGFAAPSKSKCEFGQNISAKVWT